MEDSGFVDTSPLHYCAAHVWVVAMVCCHVLFPSEDTGFNTFTSLLHYCAAHVWVVAMVCCHVLFSSRGHWLLHLLRLQMKF